MASLEEGVSASQVGVCTEASPDWVYVTTITGTKSQDIGFDELIPAGYHWGVRGTYTSVRNASFELIYNHRGGISRDDSDSDKAVTWKHNFEPSRRNTSYGNGPLKVVASPNIVNYTLNIYYDANLVDGTPSPSPSKSPSLSLPTDLPLSLFALAGLLVVVAVAVALSVLYVKIKRRQRANA